jgi:ankyrin repeat protein
VQKKRIKKGYDLLINMRIFSDALIISSILTFTLIAGCDDKSISNQTPRNFLLSTEASFPDTLPVLKQRWLFCKQCLNGKECQPTNVHECKTVTLPDRENALAKAIHDRNTEAVYFLVDDAKTDVNKISGEYRYTPLMITAYYGDVRSLQVAQFLISRGASVNYIRNVNANSTALMIAIWKNNIEFVRFLLKNGADPSLTSEGRKEGAACKVAIAYKRSEIIPIIPGCCSLIAYEPDRMQGVLNKCP